MKEAARPVKEAVRPVREAVRPVKEAVRPMRGGVAKGVAMSGGDRLRYRQAEYADNQANRRNPRAPHLTISPPCPFLPAQRLSACANP